MGRPVRVLTSVRPWMRLQMPRARMEFAGRLHIRTSCWRHIESIWFCRPRLIDRCAVPSVRPFCSFDNLTPLVGYPTKAGAR
jgi:hypothetical protein